MEADWETLQIRLSLIYQPNLSIKKLLALFKLLLNWLLLLINGLIEWVAELHRLHICEISLKIGFL